MDATSNILATVEAFADKAHGTQRRRYKPEPYIVHPLRVMNLCREHVNDIAILSAALLHDVLEDTDISELELHRFLDSTMNKHDSERTFQYVVELTEVYSKDAYPELNRSARKRKENDRLKDISAEAQTGKYHYTEHLIIIEADHSIIIQTDHPVIIQIDHPAKSLERLF